MRRFTQHLPVDEDPGIWHDKEFEDAALVIALMVSNQTIVYIYQRVRKQHKRNTD